MSEQFVTENPALVLIGIGILIGTLKIMGAALSRLITQPYNQLTASIASLTKTIEKIGEDREKDRVTTGGILNRLQAQETLCTITRSFCPHGKGNCPVED